MCLNQKWLKLKWHFSTSWRCLVDRSYFSKTVINVTIWKFTAAYQQSQVCMLWTRGTRHAALLPLQLGLCALFWGIDRKELAEFNCPGKASSVLFPCCSNHRADEGTEPWHGNKWIPGRACGGRLHHCSDKAIRLAIDFVQKKNNTSVVLHRCDLGALPCNLNLP